MITPRTLWRTVWIAPADVIDGDTVRVRDTDRDAWGAHLARLRIGPQGHLSLRLAAVDAPELHYPGGPSGLTHQPLAHGLAAADAVRRILGSSERDPSGGSDCDRTSGSAPDRPSQGAKPAPRRSADPADCEGELACLACIQGIDRYGRAIALLWPNDPFSEHRCDAGAHGLSASVNAQLLARGLAYPDFHSDLPADWQDTLAALTRQARGEGLGVWASDQSRQGIDLAEPQRLADGALVLPRLFRRIADFQRAQAGRWPLADGLGFREYLEARERPVRLRDSGRVLPFAELLTIHGTHCQLHGDVENFLYQSADPVRDLT
jgi:endonuclease YncB( thermonuclease family)